MSNHEFTPGPWEAVRCDPTYAGDPVYYGIKADIPGVGRWGDVADTLNSDHCLSIEDDRANATLIAAAPEMYRFIIDILETEHLDDAPYWVKRARNLISKAGGPP